MTDLATRQTTPYLEEFERLAIGGEPEQLRRRRQEAIERFGELGFPHRKLEEWKFTDVRPIAETRFTRAPEEHGLTLETVRPFGYPDCHELVFVDGRFAGELSTTRELPEGVFAGSLREGLETMGDRVVEHLGRHAAYDRHPFVALNTALYQDGVLVLVPDGTVLETPIHCLFLATSNGEPTVSYPRNLFLFGDDCQARLVETYAGFPGAHYLTCAVTEAVAGCNAVVNHYKVQRESTDAYHMATYQIRMDRDARYLTQSISLGGALVRNDVNAILDGEGIDCILDGLYLTAGTQHVDNHMRVEHVKPHTNSHELYKGILDDESSAVFNGRIFVHKGAQKTDAKQTNRNLLLSKNALVNTNPQLEIFADDVKCTHGSTVGRLDPDALFYLRSRGIGEEAARSLLIYAFARDLIDRVEFEPVRTDLIEFVLNRLPRGEIVRQTV